MSDVKQRIGKRAVALGSRSPLPGARKFFTALFVQQLRMRYEQLLKRPLDDEEVIYFALGIAADLRQSTTTTALEEVNR